MVEGRVGQVYRFGVLGIGLAAPLALQATTLVFGKRPSRGVTALASLLVLAGGFALRYVMVMAGRQSADDPEATFALAQGDAPWTASTP